MTHAASLVLAIDVGTSATKVSLHGADGSFRMQAGEAHPTITPRDGWAEQDPEEWWEAVRRLAPIAMSHIRAGERLAAIAVVGQAPTCVAVDEAGLPVRPAILWLDRRSTSQVAWMAERLGEARCWEVGRNRLDSYFGAAKWLWLKQEEPASFRKTRWLLQPNGFITYRLTGNLGTDPSQAGLCSPAFDLRANDWHDQTLDALGIPRTLLPPVVPSLEVIGSVTRAAAAATGLPHEAPVVCGSGDFAAACLGAGSIEPGSGALMLGTAGNLLLPGVASEDDRLINTRDALGSPLTLGGVLAGGNVQWLVSVLSEQDPTDFFARHEASGNLIEPGAEGLLYLPYLAGERSPIWDPLARGAFVGLTNRHTTSHLYRAVLEGVAFAFVEVARIAGVLGEDGVPRGPKLKSLAATDGGAHSSLWRSILASALDVPIRFDSSRSGTAVGAAFMAALATGLIRSAETIGTWVTSAEVVHPEPVAANVYRRLRPLHAGLHGLLRPTFEALSIRDG